MSRILGLDLGMRRIGVALSDPTGTIATPLATIVHRGFRQDVDRVAELCRVHGVTRIVVGWPRNMDGSAGPAARRSAKVALALGQALGLPVDLWDERLSTAAAERTLRGAGVPRDRRRDVRDRVAAAVILQAYLDARSQGLAMSGPGHNDSRHHGPAYAENRGGTRLEDA